MHMTIIRAARILHHVIPTRSAAARPRLWLAAAALALLAGCATGIGGFPGGQQYPGASGPGYGANALVGTVERVDASYDRILLTAQPSQYQRGSRVEVYFDQRTSLYYQGRQHPVAGLERGDVIRVDATQSRGRLWARSIEVVHNVRDGYRGGSGRGDHYGPGHGGQYGNQLQGTVGYVDPRARVIELEAGGGYGRDYSGRHGDRARVRYDRNTTVEYRGRRYRPENLERGDLIRIQVRRWGNDWLAEHIRVERSVRERW
ncbi:hypothetical protein [Lysobacter sp. D1-1-M9]|uniref:hypothetical protein n=1 Tax=Novilysobacter longmucuonensis TaxID=3098603 RepID=UPI002FCB247A